MFGRSAKKVIDLVKAANPTAKISHNVEKPRKGAFVVTVRGKTIVNLLNMPRPFTKLRELQMEEVASAAIAALGQ